MKDTIQYPTSIQLQSSIFDCFFVDYMKCDIPFRTVEKLL